MDLTIDRAFSIKEKHIGVSISYTRNNVRVIYTGLIAAHHTSTNYTTLPKEEIDDIINAMTVGIRWALESSNYHHVFRDSASENFVPIWNLSGTTMTLFSSYFSTFDSNGKKYFVRETDEEGVHNGDMIFCGEIVFSGACWQTKRMNIPYKDSYQIWSQIVQGWEKDFIFHHGLTVKQKIPAILTVKYSPVENLDHPLLEEDDCSGSIPMYEHTKWHSTTTLPIDFDSQGISNHDEERSKTRGKRRKRQFERKIKTQKKIQRVLFDHLKLGHERYCGSENFSFLTPYLDASNQRRLQTCQSFHCHLAKDKKTIFLAKPRAAYAWINEREQSVQVYDDQNILVRSLPWIEYPSELCQQALNSFDVNGFFVYYRNPTPYAWR